MKIFINGKEHDLISTNKFCAIALSILSEKNYADVLVSTKNEIRVQINTEFITNSSILDEIENFLCECYDVQIGKKQEDMSSFQKREKEAEILWIIIKIQSCLENKESNNQKIIFYWHKKKLPPYMLKV